MRSLDTYARRGLWALPLWAVLLLYATLTHQPDYRKDFAAWSGYVTGTGFLVGHLLGSLLGAAIGVLGFAALWAVLAELDRAALATWALVTYVVGSTFTVAVFGVAAFAQPAIGRAFLAGHTDMPALYDDVNAGPLFLTAAPGVLLLSTGLILFGIGVARSGVAPRAAGWALAVGGPLFAVVGVVLADVVQSVGAAVLLLGTAWVAWTAGRPVPLSSEAQPTT